VAKRRDSRYEAGIVPFLRTCRKRRPAAGARGLTAAKMEGCRWARSLLVGQFEFVESGLKMDACGTAGPWGCGKKPKDVRRE
jgi:hypothetical protein